MRTVVFDIEADGLLDTITRVWVVCTIEVETGEKKYWGPGDNGWMDYFNSSDILVGHNILGYDFPAIKKVTGWEPDKRVKIRDTLILSQVLDFYRFGMGGHALAVWGEALGVPKVVHEDWSQYSEDMLNRCEVDVQINLDTYEVVMKEFNNVFKNQPNIATYLRAEQAVAKWCATATELGWPFNRVKAEHLIGLLTVETDAARDALLPRLGCKVKPKDKEGGVIIVKEPKWVKSGAYDQRTANYFGVEPFSGYWGEERPIEGPFCRIIIEHLSLDSPADVKLFLTRVGWEPDTWNYKREGRSLVKTSPKITETSLEFLGGDGRLYKRYLVNMSRLRTVQGWVDALDSEDKIHGSCFTIGTPSMRTRHKLIVNVPKGGKKKDGSPVSLWGSEMRELFMCKPGWVMVGCDSVGNQARGLGHYLNSKEYTHLLLEGDIHQFNADIATGILKEMGLRDIVSRDTAKTLLYGFLFGASGGKMWTAMFSSRDDVKGKKFKDEFAKRMPGFEKLMNTIENVYKQTNKGGKGYIPSIAGNKVYVDSKHKLLVYLLQSCEKITCATALMLTVERLEAKGIPYQPLIFYHDEIDFMVPEQYATEAAEISKQAFVDGAKLYGIQIMDGSYKIGQNWLEVH